MVDIKLTLPNGYLEEEEREGYLIPHEMKAVWAVELDLLNEFMRICRKYQIKFFADGGTLLGAVRHNGFIPWDDDIDIVMTRKEFDRLDKIAADEFGYPYFWQTEWTDPGSLRGHAQLRNSLTTGILKAERDRRYQFDQGIFIDIFPIDNVPDDPNEQLRFFARLEKQYKKALRYAYFTSRFQDNGKGIRDHLRRCYHDILMICPIKSRPYKKFEELMCSYDHRSTSRVGKLFFQPIRKECVWDAKWFSSGVELQFEMLKIEAPIGYKELLTRIYGDWQTPVMIRSDHGKVIFDVDRPYIDLLR